LFLGNRLLLKPVSMADVKRHHIKAIRKKTTATTWTFWDTEQFDERGHTTYRRNWSQRPQEAGSGSSQFFACEYRPDGKIAAVSEFADSLHRQLRWRSIYSYSFRGQLKRAGNYRLTYYHNGLLKSVAGSINTEHYYYNGWGQLTRIEFGTQPGIVTCDNGTTKWQGKYNARQQLSSEAHVGIHGHEFQLLYDQAGQLIRRTSSDGSWNYECRYTYQNGLLTRTDEVFSGRAFDGPQATTTTYEYEQY
jgi:YD repeat-containing protein